MAEKRNGIYLDVFIYPGKDLAKVGEEHMYLTEGEVLFQLTDFGSVFLRKLKVIAKRPFTRLPADELQARRVWAHKMLERIK